MQGLQAQHAAGLQLGQDYSLLEWSAEGTAGALEGSAEAGLLFCEVCPAFWAWAGMLARPPAAVGLPLHESESHASVAEELLPRQPLTFVQAGHPLRGLLLPQSLLHHLIAWP